MPIKLGKSYIPQKNTLLSIVWKNFWNCKNFCHGRLQTSFSKSNAFSVKGACPPPGWCHAHFFHEWSSPLLVLSIDVSFVLKFFWKGDKNLRNWKSGPKYMEDPVEMEYEALRPPLLCPGLAPNQYSLNQSIYPTCSKKIVFKH